LHSARGLNFDLRLKGFYTPKRGEISESFPRGGTYAGKVGRGDDGTGRKKMLKGGRSERRIQRSLGERLPASGARRCFREAVKNIARVPEEIRRRERGTRSGNRS